MKLEWQNRDGVPLLLARAPGATIAFTAAQGGVSGGSFASLNLGFATRGRPGSAWPRTAGGRSRPRAPTPARAVSLRQRHGSVVRRGRTGAARRLPGRLDAPGRRATPSSPPSPACRCRARRRLPHGRARGARRRAPGGRARGLARAGRRRAGSRGGARRARLRGRRRARAPGRAATRSASDVAGQLRARFGDDVVADGRADLAACARRALERAGAAEVAIAGPVHDLRPGALPFAPARRRRQRPPGRDRLPRGRARVSVELAVVQENLARRARRRGRGRGALGPPAGRGRAAGRGQVRGAGRPGGARRGRASQLVGENRVEQLLAKQAVAGDRFTWDFIGHLQSRKARDLVGPRAPRALALDALGRRAPRSQQRAADRLPGRGQRRRRGIQAGPGAGRARRVPRGARRPRPTSASRGS